MFSKNSAEVLLQDKIKVVFLISVLFPRVDTIFKIPCDFNNSSENIIAEQWDKFICLLSDDSNVFKHSINVVPVAV